MRIESFDIKQGLIWIAESYRLFFKHSCILTILSLLVFALILILISTIYLVFSISVYQNYYSFSFGSIFFGSILSVWQVMFTVAAYRIVTRKEASPDKFSDTFIYFESKQYGQILLTIIFFEILKYLSVKISFNTHSEDARILLYTMLVLVYKFIFFLIYPIILWEKKTLYDAIKCCIRVLLKNFWPLLIFYIGSALLPLFVLLIFSYTAIVYFVTALFNQAFFFLALALIQGTLTLIPFMLAQFLIYRDCIKK